MIAETHLSNIQQELLKIYSTNMPDDELLKLKRVMGDFFKKELYRKPPNSLKTTT